jgi:hypothetical protein
MVETTVQRKRPSGSNQIKKLCGLQNRPQSDGLGFKKKWNCLICKNQNAAIFSAYFRTRSPKKGRYQTKLIFKISRKGRVPNLLATIYIGAERSNRDVQQIL